MLYDETTGLYDARARWYQPDVGRFMSEDPIGLGGGMNQYAFAGDDPINNSDPDGLLVSDFVCVEFSNGTVACSGSIGGVNITARGPDAPAEPADPPSIQGFLDGFFSSSSGGGSGGPGAKPAAPTNKATHTPSYCAGETARSNIVSLGLDVAALGVDIFAPEGKLAVAGVQAGLSFVTFTNSALHSETSGVVAGAAGFQLASLAPAAEGMGKKLAKGLPLIGFGLDLYMAGHDVSSTYASYQACRAGH
jgi:RHS repeat-associated protein